MSASVWHEQARLDAIRGGQEAANNVLSLAAYQLRREQHAERQMLDARARGIVLRLYQHLPLLMVETACIVAGRAVARGGSVADAVDAAMRHLRALGASPAPEPPAAA